MYSNMSDHETFMNLNGSSGTTSLPNQIAGSPVHLNFMDSNRQTGMNN